VVLRDLAELVQKVLRGKEIKVGDPPVRPAAN
jgi:hypothetical protein